MGWLHMNRPFDGHILIVRTEMQATQLWKEAIQLKPVQGSIEIDEKIV